jgi:hypothetical protein
MAFWVGDFAGWSIQPTMSLNAAGSRIEAGFKPRRSLLPHSSKGYSLENGRRERTSGLQPTRNLGTGPELLPPINQPLTCRYRSEGAREIAKRCHEPT